MPPDPLPPSPAPLPPALPPNARPPVPGWMWLLFGLGLVPVGMLLAVFTSGVGVSGIPGAAATGFVVGLLCGLPFVGGLALAGRFFSGIGARIMGGLLFTWLLVLGLAAVGFAGCVCLMQGGQSH